MWKEFKEFMMRGSVIDLAVGVVIGSAFTGVVTAIVKGFITPLVAFVMSLVTGSKSGKFSGMQLKLGQTGVVLDFDLIVNALISFIITGFVLFAIVKTVNKLRDLGSKEKEEEEAVLTPTEEYLQEIRDLLKQQDKRTK